MNGKKELYELFDKNGVICTGKKDQVLKQVLNTALNKIHLELTVKGQIYDFEVLEDLWVADLQTNQIFDAEYFFNRG